MSAVAVVDGVVAAAGFASLGGRAASPSAMARITAAMPALAASGRHGHAGRRSPAKSARRACRRPCCRRCNGDNVVASWNSSAALSSICGASASRRRASQAASTSRHARQASAPASATASTAAALAAPALAWRATSTPSASAGGATIASVIATRRRPAVRRSVERAGVMSTRPDASGSRPGARRGTAARSSRPAMGPARASHRGRRLVVVEATAA